jgi:hypothetical protein
VPADVKEVLYSVIDGIGREKIRSEVSADTGASKRYSQEIVEKCVQALGPEAGDEALGTLCEALLHFMLTAALLPSERKVTVSEVELDIVVPSVKSLAKDPAKTLVIQVSKDGSADRVKNAEHVQPVRDNIWAVSARRIDTDRRSYCLEGGRLHYASLIAEIKSFLAEKGVSSLKMLHG